SSKDSWICLSSAHGYVNGRVVAAGALLHAARRVFDASLDRAGDQGGGASSGIGWTVLFGRRGLRDYHRRRAYVFRRDCRVSGSNSTFDAAGAAKWNPVWRPDCDPGNPTGAEGWTGIVG